MHTYIHTIPYINTHMHTWIHTYIHTYIHAYIHTCYEYIPYIHTYHAYIHSNIHTYHTNIHTNKRNIYQFNKKFSPVPIDGNIALFNWWMPFAIHFLNRKGDKSRQSRGKWSTRNYITSLNTNSPPWTQIHLPDRKLTSLAADSPPWP
jgi:hypothetical protein